MKSRKVLMAAVLTSLLLAGCGAATEENLTREETLSAEAETEETPQAPEPETPMEEPVKEEEETGMKLCLPDEGNVKRIGRTELLEDTLWLAFSGSGAEFQFTGKKAVITFKGDSTSLLSGNGDQHARVAVYVDGERVVDDMMDEAEKSYTVVESETERECIIRIVKLSETAMSTVGIKSIEIDGEAEILPTEEKEYFIEFIGDSITCGYGVDDEDKNHHFSTKTEDVTKTYAYKTAEALDADYSMVCISGYGIISGYTADGSRNSSQTIPQYYDRLGFSYSQYAGKYPADRIWDFTQRQPDLIVMNLGTNDNSYTLGDEEKQQEFQEAYTAFIRQVRSCNPEAEILCTLGIMGSELYPYVEKAVEDYLAETGDGHIAVMKLDTQSGADGYAADWHPTEATHQKAADQLTAYINEFLK